MYNLYKLNIRNIVFLFVLILCSCDKEDDSYLFLSEDGISVNAAGGNGKIELYSDTPWSLSNSTDWITVDNTSGTGDETLTLKISTNLTGEDRSANLIFTGEKVTKTLLVEQTAAYLTLNTKEIIFDAQGTPEVLEITSNYKWTIYKAEDADWCDIDIESGEGDAVVILTPTPINGREVREESTLIFTCFNLKTEITISQKFENAAPSAPILISPENNANGIPINTLFKWNPSIDPDGDMVYYQLYVSTDRTTWTAFEEETTETSIELTEDLLDGNSTYYWKVEARDDFGAKSESEIFLLETDKSTLYVDGESILYQSSSSGYKPVHLIILGDGFIKADYLEGGAFDQAAEIAIEAFFSVEPYPTYQDYFTVYKVAGYSKERGATVKNNFTYSNVKKQTCNTLFSSVLEGGGSTGISCNYDKVYEYVQKIPAITASELPNTTVILIINLEVYAGTCVMWTDGKSIGMCPMGSTFEEIVSHEVGGHGFAKLLDEYIYYDNQTSPYNNSIQTQRYYAGGVWNWGANVCLIGDEARTHWNHYFSQPGYEEVGMYEGAYMYGKGIWRPEYNSCMNNNIPYYNAPSREAIVRRIMSISGKTFDINEFYEKDHTTTNEYGAKMILPREDFRPLAPPIIMKE